MKMPNKSKLINYGKHSIDNEDIEIISILESNGFKYDEKQIEDSTRKSGIHKGYAEFLFYK